LLTEFLFNPYRSTTIPSLCGEVEVYLHVLLTTTVEENEW